MSYSNGFKRSIDFVVALVVLVVLSPLLLIVAVCIRFSSSGGVFFRQPRVGLHGREFLIIKFRTMRIGNEKSLAQVRAGDGNITRVGALLRRSKLDELPQLLNVLIGEMSLVGPRPCLPETFRGMPAWAHRRFEARPGMTGLAQVNGNISLEWSARWKYDLQYVKSCSFIGDFRILIATVWVVIFGEEKFCKPV